MASCNSLHGSQQLHKKIFFPYPSKQLLACTGRKSTKNFFWQIGQICDKTEKKYYYIYVYQLLPLGVSCESVASE